MKSNDNYQNLNDKTNRSDIQLEVNDKINMNMNMNDHIKEQNKIIHKIAEKVDKGKPGYIELEPIILQNPQMQLYGEINNFAVCPFCKYAGNMDLEYTRSLYQKSCCCLLAIFGLFICSWIPLVLRSLSNQIYKCKNCKKVLKTLNHNQI
jgi:hypothetical protein